MSVWAEARSIPVTETGCWLWLGAEKGNGYGNVREGGRNTTAHRRAWEEQNGPVPEGLHICHKCDTRLCVNHDHLFAGTRNDNMADCVAKNRQAKGKALPQSKLSPAQVLSARRLRSVGWTLKAIAERFGVDRMTISSAIKNTTWKHI